MTPASKALGDAIGENLEGQRLASHFVARLRAEFPDTDELLRAFLLAQQASPERLRGFARRVQKELERRPADA